MKSVNSKLLLALIALFIGLSSCSKKCDLPDNSNSGSIIHDVVIYPSSGSMTGNMGNDFVINGAHKYAGEYDIRFTNGNKIPVDYSQYTILCYPTKTSCAASFNRSVVIDALTQTVKYKIEISQCKDCLQEVENENYILVPAFPSNYTVSFDVTL
jgi:hypothetical protein